ncbi:hypothetical protein LINGRAHAP2_LOCUS10773 [Linum grandiflorum]
MDLGFQGDPFTWNNGQEGNNYIRIRLDRALSNVAWRNAYDQALVSHERDIGSDHRPIVVHYYGQHPRTRCPFRFDARWLSEEEANAIILDSWRNGRSTSDRMKICQGSISTWAKEKHKLKGARESEVKNRLLEIQNTF